jgi:small redox-active disulfide protein 2
MAASDVTQITVNNRKVGIIGLESTISDMAEDYAEKTDGEIQSEMVKRLSRKNYIPDRATDNYGRAFVREFRKHLGQDYEEEAGARPLEVKILGVGCARCDGMKKAVINALAELNLAADVEHITDMREIVKYRVIGSPALLINGKTRCVGTVPSKDQIKRWLQESTDQ